MLSIESLDSVHICLPHYLHSEVAIYALNNGVDVLCEKPMDISYNNALLIKEAAENNDKVLGIVFQHQYSAGPVFVKEKLQNGALGKIISAGTELLWYRGQDYYNSADWRGKWNTEGGGVTINQAVHTLDMLRGYINSEVELVNATLSHNGETNIEIVLFKNGVKAVYYFSNNFVGFQPPMIVLNCENATVEIKGADATISYIDGWVESVYPTMK